MREACHAWAHGWFYLVRMEDGRSGMVSGFSLSVLRGFRVKRDLIPVMADMYVPPDRRKSKNEYAGRAVEVKLTGPGSAVCCEKLRLLAAICSSIAHAEGGSLNSKHGYSFH